MDFLLFLSFFNFFFFLSEEDGGFFGWDAAGFAQLFLLWRHVGDRDAPTAVDCGEGLCHIPMDPGKSPDRAEGEMDAN